MELRTILAFLRVAELESFSRAAETLGYAQSTITMQIQQLEEELGHPLFDRLNRSVHLTSFGASILPLARRMANTAQEMRSLNMTPESLTGVLRVGLVESLLFPDFIRLIPKYREKFPHVVLNLHTASSTEIIELLKKNKLDLGCYLQMNTPPFEFTHLFQRATPLVMVANRNYPASPNEVVPLENIVQRSFILPEEISFYHQMLLKELNLRGLSLKECVRLTSTRGIVEVLKYSEGVSFLPEYVVRQEVQQGYLKILSTTLPSMTIDVTVSVYREKWISPQMAGMLNLLQDELLL